MTDVEAKLNTLYRELLDRLLEIVVDEVEFEQQALQLISDTVDRACVIKGPRRNVKFVEAEYDKRHREKNPKPIYGAQPMTIDSGGLVRLIEVKGEPVSQTILDDRGEK